MSGKKLSVICWFFVGIARNSFIGGLLRAITGRKLLGKTDNSPAG